MPTTEQRPYRSSSHRVHRTQTAADAAISPFIIDPSSVKLSRRLSDTHYSGVWLRTPVSVRVVASRNQALDAINHLNSLRHPNLEQLLGAVVDSSSQKFLVTEAVPGPSLYKLITSRSAGPRLNKHLALRLAVDIGRAVVYYHSATGTGLPSLCPHTITYDPARSRAVVQLTTPCAHTDSHGLPEGGTACHTCLSRSLLMLESSSSSSSSSHSSGGARRRPSRSADVYFLARIVVAMFSPAGEECLRNEQVAMSQVRSLPTELRSCVGMCLAVNARDRLKMTQFCQVLVESMERDS